MSSVFLLREYVQGGNDAHDNRADNRSDSSCSSLPGCVYIQGSRGATAGTTPTGDDQCLQLEKIRIRTALRGCRDVFPFWCVQVFSQNPVNCVWVICGVPFAPLEVRRQAHHRTCPTASASSSPATSEEGRLYLRRLHCFGEPMGRACTAG